MPSLETPGPVGPAVLRKVAAAAMLLALVGSAPASAQGRPLQLFTRGNTADAPASPLPVGTRLLVFAEPRSGAGGRNVLPDSVPPAGNVRRIVDSIVNAQNGHGPTAAAYADSLRYLVIAKTEKDLFWSVDPRNLATPRYHSLDSVPRIRMATVQAPRRRAALDSLFAAAPATPHLEWPGPIVPQKKSMVELSKWKLAGLLLLALVVGVVGGWVARDQASRRRRVAESRARAEQSRDLRSQSYATPEFGDDRIGGGLGNETWVPQPAKEQKLDREALDQVLELRLTELESRICGHVTDQIKYARGDILGHLESSGIHPGSGTRPGLTRSTGLAALPASTSGDNGASSPAAQAFHWWCQNAGGNVGKIRVFSEAIRGRVAGSEVHVLARDRDNNAVTFVSGGAGDPVEYWLVTVNGEHLLFPRPLNQKRFMELYPVYNGDAGPQSLSSIEPASVRQDSGRWVLAAQGRVS